MNESKLVWGLGTRTHIHSCQWLWTGQFNIYPWIVSWKNWKYTIPRISFSASFIVIWSDSGQGQRVPKNESSLSPKGLTQTERMEWNEMRWRMLQFCMYMQNRSLRLAEIWYLWRSCLLYLDKIRRTRKWLTHMRQLMQTRANIVQIHAKCCCNIYIYTKFNTLITPGHL